MRRKQDLKHLPGKLILTAAFLAASAGADVYAAASACETGKRQSPIDITGAQKEKLPPISFEYQAAPMNLVNDGHTVRVRFGREQHMLLGNARHTFRQMHFHIPGGDRIEGQEFDLAMHFLHKSVAGQLVVVVALFRTGAAHAALEALLPHMPATKGGKVNVPAGRVGPAQFLPVARGYYRYEGSETAPPCTEGVTWLVLKETMTLSAGQLSALGALFPRNARAVQPLNARIVKESE